MNAAASATATPVKESVVVLAKNIGTFTKNPLGDGIDFLQFCASVRIAGATQDVCKAKAASSVRPLTDANLATNSAISVCWDAIKFGEQLPDCWR